VRLIFLVLFCAIFLGCIKNPVGTIEASNAQNRGVNTNSNSKEIPEFACRLFYLMTSVCEIESMVQRGQDRIEVMNDIYELVESVQESKLTVQSLENKSFYFENSLGVDYDGIKDDRYFQCIQVVKIYKDKEKTEFAYYEALYTNLNLNITVTVYWFGVQPLVGQKLNTDFLIFMGADQYETKGNGTRAMLIFAWPRWAEKNGYYDPSRCNNSN